MHKLTIQNGVALAVEMSPEEVAEQEARMAQLPTETEYVKALQEMMDVEARTRNYDNILSACTYATSTIAKFQAEGRACVEWRDSVWATAYATLAAVNAGDMEQPTMQQMLDLVPKMVWPIQA